MTVLCPIALAWVALCSSHQEEIDIVARHPLFERRLQLLAWHRRFHQMGSNDDDQIGLRFLEGSATKEGAQHWDLANPRQLCLVCAVLVVEQASYRKALTIPEF